jgi:hypothetical protein
MDRFRHAESQYYTLKGQLAAGRMTRQQFDAAVQGLMIQDGQGRYWAVAADSGAWLVHDGRGWAPADPYGAQPGVSQNAPPAPVQQPQGNVYLSPPAGSPYPPPSKGNRGCCGILTCGCLLPLVLVLLLAVGGFVAFQQGLVTKDGLLNILGMGPGSVEIDNFRNETVYVTLTPLDTSKGSTPAAAATLLLSPFDIASRRIESPGRFRVDFGTSRGGANLGTCSLTVKSGDQYQFVSLADKVIVNRTNNPASSGRDFVIGTSALCR